MYLISKSGYHEPNCIVECCKGAQIRPSKEKHAIPLKESAYIPKGMKCSTGIVPTTERQLERKHALNERRVPPDAAIVRYLIRYRTPIVGIVVKDHLNLFWRQLASVPIMCCVILVTLKVRGRVTLSREDRMKQLNVTGKIPVNPLITNPLIQSVSPRFGAKSHTIVGFYLGRKIIEVCDGLCRSWKVQISRTGQKLIHRIVVK
jgi:hypothetical protein